MYCNVCAVCSVLQQRMYNVHTLQKTTVNAATVVLKFHFSSNLSALVLIIFGKSVWNNISNDTLIFMCHCVYMFTPICG